MKNAWSALIAFFLLAAFASSLAVGIITERQHTAEPPELEVGDRWAYIDTFLMGDLEGQHTGFMRKGVIGDSGDTWLVTVSFEPNTISAGDPLWMEEARTVEVAKATLLGVFMEATGMRPCRADPAGPEFASPYVSRTNYSYEFLDGPLWPLSVGKKVRIIERWSTTEEYTCDTDQKAHSSSSTVVYTYEVERVESITVPAGTFRCFKILRYVEGTDKGIYARWYSPDVRNTVKITEIYSAEGYDSSYTRELESYSLNA